MNTNASYQHRRNDSWTIKRNSLSIMQCISSLCLLLGTNLLAHAAEPEAIVKYRQSVMLSQRGHMAAAAAIIHGKVDFKEQLIDHVKALEGTTKEIVRLFPVGSDVGDTKALKEVWSDHDEFQKRAFDTQQKSATLVKTVAAGDSANYAPRLKDLLDSCKSCHQTYRKKAEQ